MKNVLAVEIKDNKTIVTVSRIIKGNYNLLLHKSYGSKPLKNTYYYDVDIIEKIYEDLKSLNITNDISEKYLTVNTSRITVSTFDFPHKYEEDIEESKKKFKNAILNKQPGMRIIKTSFSNDEKTMFTTKNIKATIEATNDEYISFIVEAFTKKQIRFTKIIPVINAIKNTVIENSLKKSTISILVEEKFTQLTWIDNKKISSSIKWKFGLTDIYEYISNQMNIKKQTAKHLFKTFGSIPPGDIVDDKVIHTSQHEKEIDIYTKKDLSKYITEKVQFLFSNVKSKIETLNCGDIEIIFNGEIQSLIGFKKFASKSFNEPNIRNFQSNLIGLKPETEFITMGMLYESKKNMKYNSKKQIENIYKPKNNLLNKMLRMYEYI